MRSIFISYRRDDSAYAAGRVHDRLASEFGEEVLFMDVDAIPLGANFVKVLEDAVSSCSVLLAVIGPNWLSATDEDGNRRLDSALDFVRIEIAAALKRDIPVIPLLLDGARIPQSAQLPPDLAELSMRNGAVIRGSSFHADMAKLVKSLAPYAKTAIVPPGEGAPAVSSGQWSTAKAVAEKGRWVSQFNVGSKEPSEFGHLFIVVEGNDYLAPGAVVTGSVWDGSASPKWRVVHGHLVNNRQDAWHRVSSALTYLGPSWRPEFAQLSEGVFLAQKGRKLEKFIDHK